MNLDTDDQLEDFNDPDGNQATELPCFQLNHVGYPVEPQRTLLLTGVARSGTSFAASVAGRLGVPFLRSGRDKVSGHWEHPDLRSAFTERDEAAFTSIVEEFNSAHSIWGWKLPSLRTDFDWVVSRIRNPCFVFTFKEPLSMAIRKISKGHADNLERHFRKIFREYDHLLQFAGATNRPVLLLSYDKSLRNLDECIGEVAKFGGVDSYDFAAVKKKVAEDALRY